MDDVLDFENAFVMRVSFSAAPCGKKSGYTGSKGLEGYVLYNHYIKRVSN